MSAPIEDAMHLDAITEVTWIQLLHSSGLSESELRELVRYGALVPLNLDAPVWTFEARWLVVAKTASPVRHDFELDPYAVSVVLSYLERIGRLEEIGRCARKQVGGNMIPETAHGRSSKARQRRHFCLLAFSVNQALGATWPERVGTAEVRPGEVTRGRLPLIEYADGSDVGTSHHYRGQEARAGCLAHLRPRGRVRMSPRFAALRRLSIPRQ
jgi:hypothetical protein